MLEGYDFVLEDTLAKHHLETMTEYWAERGYTLIQTFDQSQGLICALYAKQKETPCNN